MQPKQYTDVYITYKNGKDKRFHGYVLDAKTGDYDKMKSLCDTRDKIESFSFAAIKNPLEINGKPVFASVDDIVNDFDLRLQKEGVNTYYCKISIAFLREGNQCFTSYFMVYSNDTCNRLNDFFRARPGTGSFSVDPVESKAFILSERVWANIDDVMTNIEATTAVPIACKPIHLLCLQYKDGRRLTIPFAGSDKELVSVMDSICYNFGVSILLEKFEGYPPWGVYTNRDDVMDSLKLYERNLSIQIK